MKFKSSWLLFIMIFILGLGMFPSVVSAESAPRNLIFIDFPENEDQEIPSSVPPPPPPPSPPAVVLGSDDGGGYTSANPWVNHATNNCGVVRMEPGTIPEGVTITVEEFPFPPQDSNGVWGLSSLVSVNVNNDGGGGSSLNSPGAEVCICAAGTGTSPVMAFWSPGPNGGTYTPVSSYWSGGSICTRTNGSSTFGVVDFSDFN